MSNNIKQTAKDLLTNEDAVLLAYRLQAVWSNPLLAAQALYAEATPLLLDELETLIGLVDHLKGRATYADEPTPVSAEEQAIHRYMIGTKDSLRGQGQLKLSTIFKDSNGGRN